MPAFGLTDKQTWICIVGLLDDSEIERIDRSWTRTWRAWRSLRTRNRHCRALPWTAVLHDWVTTVDHKKIGIMYVLMAVVFLVIGGCRGPVDPLAALLAAEPRHLRPDTLQSAVHDARHHDGLLRGHADPDRHGQLPGAADDRGPRHGLPAAQRPGLLGDALRRPAGLFQLCHRRRPGHRLVCLCPADRARLRPRSRPPISGPSGCWSAASARRGGHQLHRHHPVAALPRHDACARSLSSPGRRSGPPCRFSSRSRR